MAPVVGRILTQMVLGEKVSYDVIPFRLSRFTSPKSSLQNFSFRPRSPCVIHGMVRTSLENSLKIRKLLDIREKSLNFPQKSLNVFESSLNKNNLRLKKKHFLRKGMIESTAIHKFFLGEHEKSFLMISVFPAWFIFRNLTYPFNRSLLEEVIAISEPPSTCAF